MLSGLRLNAKSKVASTQHSQPINTLLDGTVDSPLILGEGSMWLALIACLLSWQER